MPRIRSLDVSAYTVPTDGPESDGTLEWNATTMVLVQAQAEDQVGVGYSYTDVSAGVLIDERLRAVVLACDALAPPDAWRKMVAAVRNLGVPGICATAISAVDAALWDLKAKLLNVPLVQLLGAVRERVHIYGSGGFTSYSPERLQRQLADWVEHGITRVKMKVGRNPSCDVERVRLARAAIGDNAELFVDANGAYDRKQALAFAEAFAGHNVTWFEEPVVSDDLVGLRLLRDRAPAGMNITAGEYGYDAGYFRRMLEAGAVDVLQADATRCLGITGFMQAGALCDSFNMPLSAHTAPALHAHPCCALRRVIHVEYFYDHARIESMFFDGALDAVDGALQPDLTRPGLGIEFKSADAASFRVWSARH